MSAINRRQFVRTASVFLGASATPKARAFFAGKSPVITKITILQVPGDFVRPVAMNAYDERPVGKNGAIRLVKVHLSDGSYGLGVEGYAPIKEDGLSFLKRMVGVAPEDVFLWNGNHIAGHAPQFKKELLDEKNAWFELALLDAVGKVRNIPVYALFGTAVRERIDAYDGSLYFVDVASGKDAREVATVAKAIRDDGYRGLKIKIGRPWKWMRGEPGVARDIEAVIAAREAIGANMTLMADANNGYQGELDWAVRLLAECSTCNLEWIEEIFPETVEDYKKLHTTLRDCNCDTPVADGESVRSMDSFKPFLDAGVYRYIQPDMRTCGFSKILRAADLAAAHHVSVAPHNWMSELGKIACMHASMLRTNIPLVEDDRYRDFAFDSSAYEFRDGQWIVPVRPGWGIELSPEYEFFRKAGNEIVIV